MPLSGGTLECSRAEKNRSVSSAPDKCSSDLKRLERHVCVPSVFLGTFPVDDKES